MDLHGAGVAEGDGGLEDGNGSDDSGDGGDGSAEEGEEHWLEGEGCGGWFGCAGREGGREREERVWIDVCVTSVLGDSLR